MSIKNFFNTQISTNIKEGILFHYLQGICRIKKNQFKAIYDPFLRGAQVKATPYEWGWIMSIYGIILSHKMT